MPQIGARRLRQLEAVASIVRIAIGESRITSEILSFQFFVVFKSAGSQQDSCARADNKACCLFRSVRQRRDHPTEESCVRVHGGRLELFAAQDCRREDSIEM